MKVNYNISIHLYLQNHQHLDILVFSKSSYSETWQKTQFATAILFCFIFTAQRAEGPDIKCFVIFLDFHFNSNKRITGANENEPKQSTRYL